ncbi:MAG: hypothetical protein MK214_03105 [Thalassotalea sp.]|nr:hypothetical protein [Thalassotalea sp.]
MAFRNTNTRYLIVSALADLSPQTIADIALTDNMSPFESARAFDNLKLNGFNDMTLPLNTTE